MISVNKYTGRKIMSKVEPKVEPKIPVFKQTGLMEFGEMLKEHASQNAQREDQNTQQEDLPEEEREILEATNKQIQAYRESEVFKEKLNGIDWNSKDRLGLLQQIESRSCGISLDYLNIVEMVLMKVENMMCHKNPNFLGFAKNCISDQQVKMLLEQIRIKRFGMLSSGFGSNFPVEVQLLLSMVMIGYKTYTSNLGKRLEDDFSDDDNED